jgi:hypothetical protein
MRFSILAAVAVALLASTPARCQEAPGAAVSQNTARIAADILTLVAMLRGQVDADQAEIARLTALAGPASMPAHPVPKPAHRDHANPPPADATTDAPPAQGASAPPPPAIAPAGTVPAAGK